MTDSRKYDLTIGDFMVLHRGGPDIAAAAWGNVCAVTVTNGSVTRLELRSENPDGTEAAREWYELDGEHPWTIAEHRPASQNRKHAGAKSLRTALFEGPTPGFTPGIDLNVLTGQLKTYSPMLEALRYRLPEIKPSSWDDVVIGSTVRVRVTATGEMFSAEVTPSPRRPARDRPGPHVHGISTRSAIVRDGWELLKVTPPKPALPIDDGAVIRLPRTARKIQLHLIRGQWVDPTGLCTPWTADQIRKHDFEIILPEKSDTLNVTLDAAWKV